MDHGQGYENVEYVVKADIATSGRSEGQELPKQT